MNKTYLITGGAGFIGSNFANRLISQGSKVLIYDNLSRQGTEKNLEWLYSNHGSAGFEFIQKDIRDKQALASAAFNVDVIVHLAGQVAVTTSVIDPREDFEVNALGTFNALEAARLSGRQPIFLYASTNKVYGGIDDLAIIENEDSYAYRDFPEGISEQRNLDFHSPYGCSKGSGDQYVRDYARIYDLPTVVLRQSCIYGPRQFGLEDQGWVAWFVIAAYHQRPITIFGDGKQVRDLLYIEDLLDAYQAAITRIDHSAGKVFNIGGGHGNTLSVWAQFGPILERLFGRSIPVTFRDWRPGDQKIYVSDIRYAMETLAWRPRTTVEEGIQKLFSWVEANEGLFREIL